MINQLHDYQNLLKIMAVRKENNRKGNQKLIHPFLKQNK